MLAEGLQIYSAIIQVFSGTEWQSKYFYILGWGESLIINRKQRCFIAYETANQRYKKCGKLVTDWIRNLVSLLPLKRHLKFVR